MTTQQINQLTEVAHAQRALEDQLDEFTGKQANDSEFHRSIQDQINVVTQTRLLSQVI